MSDKPLLALLRRVPNPSAGDPGKTVIELALEIFGNDSRWTRETVRTRLRAEMRAGNVVCGRGIRVNMAGNQHGEPVYRVVSKK